MVFSYTLLHTQMLQYKYIGFWTKWELGNWGIRFRTVTH